MHLITLQINTAPSDLEFMDSVLNHQIKTLHDQVNEIVITADIRPSKGRFNFTDSLIAEFKNELVKVNDKWPKCRIEFVDYSEESIEMVAKTLWGKRRLPIKDYRGGPFYSYFYGIYKSENEYILHLDSDILLGGGADTWCQDAIDIYNSDDSLLFIKPLSGPPPLNDEIPPQFIKSSAKYNNHPHSYLVNTFSTRSFLTSKKRLSKILNNAKFERPDLLRTILAIWNGNPRVKAPEQIISQALQKNKIYRLDYLGNNKGLWTLHPPFRSEMFFKKLPSIITAVEQNIIPNEQRGHFDMNQSFIDWSDAIHELPFYRRYKAKRRFLR